MGDIKRFTLAQVAANNGTKNSPVWMVYRDSVYDVTNYVDEHPGDRETILEEAGKDATKGFDDVGHSSDARTVLNKYKIGEIVEEEKKYDANGKKKKKVVAAPPEETNRGLCRIITCGLMG